MHFFNPHYDDPYSTGGLPEKRFVFVRGNRLPERFATGGNWLVAELGFGLGLAFLATWQAWQQHAPTGARLTFLSTEKHPQPPEILQQTHADYPETAPLSQALLAAYTQVPGWQTHTFGTLTLHLFVGEAQEALATPPTDLTQNWQADAWFLDGHDPRKNPALWEPNLLKTVADHTKPGGTASTYSAAGHVRRALAEAGFTVTKSAGFPPKRDMTTAQKQ